MKTLLAYCMILLSLAGLPFEGFCADVPTSELQPVSYALTVEEADFFNSAAASNEADPAFRITLQNVSAPSAAWVAIFGLAMVLAACVLSKKPR